MSNKLILGDNLEVLKAMDSEIIDLCYIDPPFGTQRNWGEFDDKWKNLEEYINWLKVRVKEIHRVLKPTGSFYLHCDWHANCEIKCFILDEIFGRKNFKNEIIWKRTNGHNDALKKLGTVTDVIFLYAKSKIFTFNPQYNPLDPNYVKKFYRYMDNCGIFRRETINDTNSSAAKYRLTDICKPDSKGYRYEYKGYSCPKNGWNCPISTMEKYDANGELYFPKEKSGRICRKKYLKDSKGKIISNLWDDIKNVQAFSKENANYITQKPEKLLGRIIKASSNPGDTVLDAFCGSGTTCSVAAKLERNFIGIDCGEKAIEIAQNRLKNNGFNDFEVTNYAINP
jgi:DNA modification methylase